MRKIIFFLALSSLVGAEQLTGTLTKAQNNQLEVKSETDHKLWKFELQSKPLPSPLKVGDRVTVEYTPQRVAVASDSGQRQCLQYLVVTSVKLAGK